jgi:hypothetical protein
MSIKFKILGAFIVISLFGCSGNSDTTSIDSSRDIKRFAGVVNNSSVKGAEVAAIPIGKHGQFTFDENDELQADTKFIDDKGRYRFTLDVRDVGPYVLSITTPEFEPETESEKAAKSSCQLALGCDVNEVSLISFGEYFTLAANQHWSAAVESVAEGQFIVINPITEMARVLGFFTYKNDSVETSTTEGSTPAPNYYSNYGIVKGNSQTASVLGLGDILSIEPANLALLHMLDTNTSTAIEESIRYGALLAAWQKLELEYNNQLVEGDFIFQHEAIFQFLENQGQLYQADSSGVQVLTLKKWYEAAFKNLEEVRDYHANLNRVVPKEVALVLARFDNEIGDLIDGEPTAGVPVIHEQFVDDYSDAVVKTKAMVNYLSNLQSNFATEEYRNSIKASSDLVTAETRRLSPSFDLILQKILSVNAYYLSCTHGACDTQSEWHSAEENVFVASENTLTIVQAGGTTLELSQGLVFDESNDEESTSTNTHDLFLSGVLEFDGLRLELSDFTPEGEVGVKSSARFSFPTALEKLPLPPQKIAGGMGASVDESLVPDYIELVMPSFKLYDSAQEGESNELKVSGFLTALMIANIDAGDLIEGKADTEKLGKRYNLANVKATLILSGQSKGQVESSAGVVTELRDNALFYMEASASESFVSGQDSTAYFPDTVYPTFEAFFKPRAGLELAKTSPFPLVITRLGTMNLQRLDSDGGFSEDLNDVVEVKYIELDYEIGGLERYVVYPKASDDDQYWGLICTTLPEDEADLDATDGYTKPVVDDDGKPVLDSEGNQLQRALMACPFRDKYTGEDNPDDFVNQVYAKNKNLVNLREYNGHGVYRIKYPVNAEGLLKPFTQETPHLGIVEESIVLGVDSMRLQFKPNLVNQAGASYLPESILDISLVWRTHDLIDVNALLAFDSTRVINNPNGSGLPYLAVGSDSESYSVAYRTDADGNESGEYVMAWAGVNFVDGPIPADGTKVMQKTDDENLRQGVFAGIGSNVSYLPYSKRDLEKLNSVDGAGISEEKCGFFARGTTPTDAEDCEAIAYLTFRGLVTGSLREERDGAYVIRYIDGSFQVLGVK